MHGRHALLPPYCHNRASISLQRRRSSCWPARGLIGRTQRFVRDSPLEGDGFEPSVPREGLAEDRDDGSPFRGRQRRKIPAEESSESAVQMNMRS